MKEQYLKLFLTPEARARLTNIKMVKPDVAVLVEEQIMQLGSSGRLRQPLTDEELRSILARLTPSKREFKIKFA